MLSGSLSRPLLGLIVALSAVPPAFAAPVQQNAPAEAAVLSPLSVIKRADLAFGTLVVTGAGTAVVDPVSGARTATGGVVPAGNAAHAATFTATGSRNAVALIRLPKNPATVTRVGGTETMTVSNWTLDGNTNRRVPIDQTFDFSVGATVNVAAAQAEGTYTGTFTVTVQYP
jgi:hypothetical protein